MPIGLSVIMICLNEGKQIVPSLQALSAWRERGAEVILVDGGSDDDTVALAQPWVDQVITSPRGRAHQLNQGAAAAHGQTLVFLHADTLVPANGDQTIQNALSSAIAWGRFDVSIQGRSSWLGLVAALMNTRSRLTRIATGDQALFMTRAAFDTVGGFAPQPLMEDIEICKQLRRLANPICLKDKVLTSGRRWDTNGVWRTIVLMWSLRWRYWRGESAESLAKEYQ
jgi:rSAM/selenodomain-associated transferase 2